MKFEGDLLGDNYLTMKVLEDNFDVYFTSNCKYCINKSGDWFDLSANTSVTANAGDTLSFKAHITKTSAGSGVGRFFASKKFNLSGNCMSLIFEDEAANNFSLKDQVSAFDHLFANQPVVNIAPNFLPATTLSDYCYEYMFGGCTSLVTAPDLPATKLATDCYMEMFFNNRSLRYAPKLPATTMQSRCYHSMFKWCSNLIVAPDLPATKLSTACYAYMFDGCGNLNESPKLPATTLADHCYYYMFADTWVLPDCSNIDFYSSSVVSSGGLRGLFGGTRWTYHQLSEVLPVNSNGECYLPCTTLADYCYEFMFADCTDFTVAPKLPATTLAERCYSNMFYGNYNLVTPPELPATTLADSCYDSMFQECRNLEIAPELPATILKDCCYYNMFESCAIKNPPELPSTRLANYCYAYMFAGCELETAPELPATTLANFCYEGMFDRCDKLTTAPDLPATTLVTGCYNWMFADCSKLNYIKILAHDISVDYLNNFAYGAPREGTLVMSANANWIPTDLDSVFSTWTIQIV